MNIIAKDHEIIIRKGEDKDAYYNATGKGKGKLKGKVKGLVGSGKVMDTLGKAQGVLAALGVGQQSATVETGPVESGMSTTTKVLIGVGVLAVVVGVVVFSKKK